MLSLSAPLRSLDRVNSHMHTNTQTHATNIAAVSSGQPAQPACSSAKEPMRNELNIKVIARLSAHRPFRSNCIDLFYAFFSNNTKRRDDRRALVSLLAHRRAQTHMYTPTRIYRVEAREQKELVRSDL